MLSCLPWDRCCSHVTRNNPFHLISLGCPKNRVDAERILSVLTRSGYQYTPEPEEASLIIVNTCAFIEPAVEESIDAILDKCALNPDALLVVAGCLPLRYGDQLLDPLPEVDLFIGPEQIEALPELLALKIRSLKNRKGLPQPEAPHQGDLATSPRVLTTRGYAYLRIAEGCSRRCRYCTIPSIRGPFKSEELEALEQEARWLASRGVRELVLVAQDTSNYGIDRGIKNWLTTLLRSLQSTKGIRWIRLMYLHPASVPSDLARTMNEADVILPYLDIPIQHVADKVLRAMRRPGKGDRIRKLIDRLRNEVPNLVLRTTLMVGYPGEGDAEFGELRGFVESARIEHLGVFTYSPEQGTPAFKLGDPVADEVKAARAEEIRTIHSRVIEERNRRRIGSIEECLIEGPSEETEYLLQGRMWDQAPEVDGSLYVTSGQATAGEIHTVRITETFGPDLFGELIPEQITRRDNSREGRRGREGRR
ncbi:MAG: 30S ribosomal protein S12 methylthiotransferase RimO [Thermodesulfobacteriota bacterium]